MSTLTDKFVFILVDATVKATLLLALAAIIAIFARRASASFRHLIWALGLGCALCLPLLSQTLPHWRVPLRTPVVQPRQAALLPPPALPPSPKASGTKNESASISAASATPSQATDVSSPVHSVSMPAAPAYPAMPDQVPWVAWTLLLWATGVFLVLVRMARGAMRLRAVAATSTHVEDGIFAAIKAAALKAMHINRSVVLLVASKATRVTVPITWGAQCPMIVLPAEADAWSQDKLRAALLHEMAHVRRWDWLLQTLAHLICVLYWFNPLMWLAARKMRAESETACDDMVLAAGMPAADYARHLLDVAISVRDERRLGLGAVAMAQTPRIEGRLRTVLAIGLSRRPPTRRIISGVLITGLVLAVPLAALRLVVHAQGVAVPAADRLQLQGDFTLRYAVTTADLTTTEAQFREYQQLRASYERELKRDPYFQPVPPEFYAPFSYFQSRKPRISQEIITISAQGGRLLWRRENKGHTFALVYNGRNGTQLFSDGHSGRVEPGLQFAEMTDCPLPAVGLPHVPLIKEATLLSSLGDQQTWQGMCPVENGQVEQGKVLYSSAVVHAVQGGGTWRVSDVDSLDQRFVFLQHQWFKGQWVASHMTFTKYTSADLPAVSSRFSSLAELLAFSAAHRTPTRVCEYRLLSASDTPLDLSARSMRQVSAAYPTYHAEATSPLELDSYDVQEALHLRYHLQDWANANKASLQQMAQGQASASAATTRVAASLQALPFPLWQGDLRPGHVWDGDPRIGHDGQKPVFTAERLSAQATTARDFEIARSRDAGTSHIVLWASGRITQNTAQGTASIGSQQEIVPAFFVGNTSDIAENAPDAASEALPNAFASTQPASSNAAATMPAPRFRRYVSKPLPDGTRYTFLYPAYLRKIDQGSLDQSNVFITVRIAAYGQRDVVPQTQNGIFIMERGTHIPKLVPHAEFCCVVVGPPDSKYVGKVPLRQERQWVGEYGSHHDLYLTDARTRRRFLLTHEDRYLRDLFVQTDPVIMSSFRILPPGTPVP